MASTPRAVLFDWGGVVSPWRDVDAREPWQDFAAGYGTMACALTSLTSALVAAEDRVWAASREHGVASSLDGLLTAAGLDPGHEATQAGVAAYRSFWEARSMTHPGIEALWSSLRARGLRLGLLSNTVFPAAWHRDWLERDGVLHLLDATVFSSDLPVAKPHPDAFRAAASAVGFAPEDCVYVGDRLYEDVSGSQAVGMRAILVPHSRIPVDQLRETEAQPDAVAYELDDVAAIVESWGA